MAEDDDSAAVLSDVDEDESPDAAPLTSNSSTLQQQLEDARRDRDASERALKDSEQRLSRLTALARDTIKKRDEALRVKEEAVRERDEAVRLRSEAIGEREEAVRVRDEVSDQLRGVQTEIATLTQMLTSGMEKISGKISAYRAFPPEGLPRSQKYTGLSAVAYGVIKRANEIVEELLRQVELASKARDEARESVEQRNYEIAIEVSELEAKISGLRDEVSSKASEIERLSGSVAEMETEIADLRRFGDEADEKARALEAKLDSHRPVFLEQLNYLSKLHEEIQEMVKVASSDGKSDETETTSSVFVSNEVDSDENLKVSVDGLRSVLELAGVAREKVREKIEERDGEVKSCREKIDALIEEKQHIGTLLRSVLLSNKSEVLQVAEEGFREAGIELRLDENERSSIEANDDEVYSLAGALGNTVKESQIKIIELQHLVEALRAESSLLKARLDAQTKEINQQKLQIKDLEEKECIANESVEGLMMDITAAEEEIARWKAAAEQEAAAGGAVEKEFQTQILTLQKELEDRKQAMQQLENKLKFKEETAAAAMAAREAAEKSLRLADIRSTRLRQRLEELSRQVEQSDGQSNSLSGSSGARYACWPWQWLGLNFVRYVGPPEAPENSNEMELSEPLI